MGSQGFIKQIVKTIFIKNSIRTLEFMQYLENVIISLKSNEIIVENKKIPYADKI